MPESPGLRPPLGGEPPLPWWRLPIMWLVVAGPAIVVVAGFATLALAIVYPDQALDEGGAAAPTAATPAPRTGAQAAPGVR